MSEASIKELTRKIEDNTKAVNSLLEQMKSLGEGAKHTNDALSALTVVLREIHEAAEKERRGVTLYIDGIE